VRDSASTRVSLRTAALSLLLLITLGLVAAGSAGAVTITSWVGGKAAVPAVVTASSAGCPGTVIMVTGSGFVSDGGIVSVTIGGVPASEIVVGSDQYLYARVGPGATSGPVVVTTKAGTARATPDAQVVPCQSTATATVKPTINSVTPQRAKAGKKVRLDGVGFVGTTSVTVAGEAASYSIPSDNLMWVKVPTDAKSGLLTIVVKNNLGSAKVVFQRIA
jgi:IPT/TIG domain